MEGVLHKCSRGKGVSPVANWKERIVQVTWDEPVLRYFDPQLLLKGSMEIGTDLRVRLLEESEASGHKNAFEIKSAGER
ncbi:hypothetical protein B484DRAFT_406768 [Ochromonadaceae sp. CCMP2298]|nr:hypothetical protein B484DRAFT_406768 [Ochromonadaceae sp. CCMP2298]